MQSRFQVFGLAHVTVLVLVPLVAAALAAVQRRFLGPSKALRYGLALILLLCAICYYGAFVVHGESIFPKHMPLELCDLSLWLVMFTLIKLRPAVFDVTYYWALAGATMALLTPNLTYPTLLEEAQFFANHGLVVAAVLYLVWSGQARPRPGSVVRAMIAVNIVAVLVGAFDYLFKTDYMFLRAKPPTVSLLDVFGPWPWYILACEGAGLVLFMLLYLPFWRKPAEETAAEEEPAEVPVSR